ncbi:MAG: DNA-3-methyladenine glycosylase 2 family protein [Verrucomicrobiales bacterium]|nr:DNA-3-methyladenine glycosylase 2 family protein [Verrucomicrobiales bacterium]
MVPNARQIARLPDEAIVERLTEVRGVGRWTVEMLLMFQLGRPDVLPIDDFGVRNGFRLAYGLDAMPKPRDVLAHGERWRPHRSAAAWYLWRATELDWPGGG